MNLAGRGICAFIQLDWFDVFLPCFDSIKQEVQLAQWAQPAYLIYYK